MLRGVLIGAAITLVAVVGHRWVAQEPKAPVVVEQTQAAPECPKPVVKKRRK